MDKRLANYWRSSNFCFKK